MRIAATGTESFGSVSRVSETPLVIKFGGTSVGDGARFVNAAKIVAEAAHNRPVAVVVSAMSGTTDALIGHANSTGNARTQTGTAHGGSFADLESSLLERHLRAAREAVAEEHLPVVEERVRWLLGRLAEVVRAPFEDPVARRDEVSVFGERLSAGILAGAIKSLGSPAAVVSEDPIATNSVFGDATIDPEATRERCSRHVEPLLAENNVAVVPGYVGRAPDGSATTLGRGGSDLSATALGSGLGSDEVWIMSDVDGVLSADPRIVDEPALLPKLSYREAATFAALGAKVLHPRTMEPALASDMEVWVRNTFRPENSGTSVSAQEVEAGVRCTALKRGFAVEVPCTSGHRSAAAAVVCIGSPTKADLSRGLKFLREAGITLLHSGISAPGLVFVVSEEAAEEALRVLHGALVRGREVSEVVEGVA